MAINKNLFHLIYFQKSKVKTMLIIFIAVNTLTKVLSLWNEAVVHCE